MLAKYLNSADIKNKMKQIIMDQMKQFKRSRKTREKLLYLTFIEMMCEHELISSRTFQNDFFDDLNVMLDDNGSQK